MNVEIPEDLYRRAAEIAKTQHISVDDLFASAFAEQMASWDRIRRRAEQGDRSKFLAVLDNVADVEPEVDDRL